MYFNEIGGYSSTCTMVSLDTLKSDGLDCFFVGECSINIFNMTPFIGCHKNIKNFGIIWHFYSDGSGFHVWECSKNISMLEILARQVSMLLGHFHLCRKRIPHPGVDVGNCRGYAGLPIPRLWTIYSMNAGISSSSWLRQRKLKFLTEFCPAEDLIFESGSGFHLGLAFKNMNRYYK